MKTRKLKEDGAAAVPTMSAGSGQIAGIGVGPQGEPGVNMSIRKKKWKQDKQQSKQLHVPMDMVSGGLTEGQKPLDIDLWAAAQEMAKDEYPDHPTPDSTKFAIDWYLEHGGEYASNTAKNEAVDSSVLDKPTLTPQEIADKHKVPVSDIEAQLKKGIPVEREHTSSEAAAREIALDHLAEVPDYYDKLKKVEEDLRKWFGKGKTGGIGGGGWDRYNTQGERIGKCGDAEDRGGEGEGKPKCLSKEKAAQLRAQGGKQAIANAVKRKKAQDPVTDRKGTGGAPRPVSNRIGESMLHEKNVPTNPELWSRAKSEAKKRFDVYPSAYANGWAAKWYKEHGGGWKSKADEAASPAQQAAIAIAMKKAGKTPKKESNTPADREWGTDSLVRIYKQDTPGELAEAVALVELLSLSDAWEKITTCQQCKKKLSPREQKLGFRICDACVKKNKGKVWGKDSDDVYDEDIRWYDTYTEDTDCGCDTPVKEALSVSKKPISRVVVDYMHGKSNGSMSQTRAVLAVSNLARPQARSESAVLAYLKKRHPKEDVILLNVDFLDSAGKPIGESVHHLEEAEYQGRKVTLGKPFRTPSGPKKFSVYVTNDKGNVVKVNFGDPNMEIKRDDPDRRKAYRNRHHCDNPGPRWKAEYWSCRMWSAKPVSKIAEATSTIQQNLPHLPISKLQAKVVLIAVPKDPRAGDGRGFWKLGDAVYRGSVDGPKDIHGAPLDKRWEGSYSHFTRYFDSVYSQHYKKTKDWK